MKKSMSFRVTDELGRDVRELAHKRKTSLSALIEWLLDVSLRSNIDFSSLPDAQGWLGDKLDCRVSTDLLARLRPVCKGLGVSPAVYARRLMYAGQVGRLALKQMGTDYRLVATHEQN